MQYFPHQRFGFHVGSKYFTEDESKNTFVSHRAGLINKFNKT